MSVPAGNTRPRVDFLGNLLTKNLPSPSTGNAPKQTCVENKILNRKIKTRVRTLLCKARWVEHVIPRRCPQAQCCSDTSGLGYPTSPHNPIAMGRPTPGGPGGPCLQLFPVSSAE